MMMTDRWKGVEMVVYRRRKNRIGQVLGALWIFIMTLVDMFTSICGHHFSVFCALDLRFIRIRVQCQCIK